MMYTIRVRLTFRIIVFYSFAVCSILPIFFLAMDLALDVTSNCRVRVLLVPVSPIKKSTFYKYVELVKTFNVVRLGDVTPDLKKGASGNNNLHNMCNIPTE